MSMARGARKFITEEESMMSDVSITPLVDCAFTILIVFMLLAPIAEQGLGIKLPRARAKKIESKDSFSVEIDSKGWIYLDKERVTEETLSNMLSALATTKENLTVYLKADQRNSYGTIVEIMDIIKNAGIENLGIVTQEKPKDEKPR
jgi:biopolymer transport protein TolR